MRVSIINPAFKQLLLGKSILFFCFIISCTEPTSKEKPADGLDKETPEFQAKVDSMVQATMKKALFDTIGLWNAPVTVTKARLIEQEYSSYRNVRLTFKNISDKKIEGIKFKWYGENAFGEPADMGSTIDGFGYGNTDETFPKGRTLTLTWNVLSRDGKKIILAWPTEVVFSDGTKWKIGAK